MRQRWLILLLLLLPAAHPLMIPLVGVPSHLLWWVHVLPVALVSFRTGPGGAGGIVSGSVLLVILGERVFGAGYGSPATWETALALAVALFGTHVLVAGFALHARTVARRYQMLFDNAASAVLRTDARGKIIAANPAALELLDCSWEAIAGRPFQGVPWLAMVPEPWRLMEGGWSGCIPTGPDQATRAYVTAVTAGGPGATGYQVILVNRTDDVARETELERQSRLAVLGSTLAGVAHEMKTPLQIITGYTELGLDDEHLGEGPRETLEIVAEQARRLDDLVRELLGFSRPADASDRAHPADVVSRVVGLQRVARGSAVRLVERIEWPGSVVGSPSRIEQIVANLVSNAIDASPPGDGTVEVAVRIEGDDALVVVSDNGDGIDPELGDRIFEPFVTSKPEGKGTGLGLAICRRLAASLGGSLVARNRRGGGAEFTLRLPLPGPRDGRSEDMGRTVAA